jgi:hypothetical protein
VGQEPERQKPKLSKLDLIAIGRLKAYCFTVRTTINVEKLKVKISEQESIIRLDFSFWLVVLVLTVR